MKVLVAPVKIWFARFKSATFEESAASAREAVGSDTEPAEMVSPFAPVINPCAVNVPCVEMFPAVVVVAFPAMVSVPEA